MSSVECSPAPYCPQPVSLVPCLQSLQRSSPPAGGAAAAPAPKAVALPQTAAERPDADSQNGTEARPVAGSDGARTAAAAPDVCSDLSTAHTITTQTKYIPVVVMAHVSAFVYAN